jgi:hypothetical protein
MPKDTLRSIGVCEKCLGSTNPKRPGDQPRWCDECIRVDHERRNRNDKYQDIHKKIKRDAKVAKKENKERQKKLDKLNELNKEKGITQKKKSGFCVIL